jgi:hypothetical protein
MSRAKVKPVSEQRQARLAGYAGLGERAAGTLERAGGTAQALKIAVKISHVIRG